MKAARSAAGTIFLAAALVLSGPALAASRGAEGSGKSRAAEDWVEPVTGIRFIHLQGGEFTMGSDGGHEDEAPPHRVRVRSFSIGRCEVTQSQWEKVMGHNPSHFAPCPECPVEQVSWEDAQSFLKKAESLTGLTFRLPTEAEWEFAAGGGEAHQRWPGTNSEREPGEYIWFSGNFSGKTRPVGKKLPNLFGLHDMGGNVAEWCSDWYGREYYGKSPIDDPRGPSLGKRRVVRGGSWLSGPLDTRTAVRFMRPLGTRSRTLGFRAVVDGGPPEE